MDGEQLTLFMTAAFMLVLILGWVLRGVYARLTKDKEYNPAEVAAMQQQLLSFEQSAAAGEEALGEAKRSIIQLESERDALSDELGRARQQIMELSKN